MKSNLDSTSVTVTQLVSQRMDTSEISFSTGDSYTLDPGMGIQFLNRSPLSIPEEGMGPKLGIIIEEVGSLQDIEGRLSYVISDGKTYDFEFARTLDGTVRVQSAGSVPAGTENVKLTFNAGFADGVVIVGTVDVGGGERSGKKK